MTAPKAAGEASRPYVFCHMLTSLDGKIMGDFMATANGSEAGEVFCDLVFSAKRFYRHQGWLSGRVTTDDNFTFFEKPALPESFAPVPAGDFVAARTGMYYVPINPKGRLGWKENALTYAGVTAHVVEVLTEEASEAYRAFLRGLGISYVIAGRSALDAPLALAKLREKFGVETLMLGGGVLNWSFIRQGLCDEVSVVLSASADASPETPALFTAREGLSQAAPVDFELIGAEKRSRNTLWLRYRTGEILGR